MIDKAHKDTDKIIEEIEKELKYNYQECLKLLKKELKKVTDEINAIEGEKDEIKRGVLLRRSKRLKKFINKISNDLQKANEQAVNIVKNNSLDVYLINHDFATYNIEIESGIDTEYNLMNRDSVKKILTKELSPFTEMAYNGLVDKDILTRELKRELIQSVMLGESIQKLAKRIQNVTKKNWNDSIRIARTEMTRVQKSGRYDAFKRGEELGLKLKKRWVSTLDSRTRRSHARLMGETVGLDEKFSNGLSYPGGIGKASEVINCRCTCVAELDYKKTDKELKLDEKLKKMSYESWLKHHGKGRS